MALFETIDLNDVGAAANALDVDGWLLFDFRGLNPVVGRVVGYTGMGSRRLFIYLSADRPVAIAHRIELQGLDGFPGEIRPYASWTELHEELERLVSGKRIAMEVSPDDAVPYLDRVPAGVVGLIERLGGTVVPSASLVSQFAAKWSAEELAGHRRAAEALAEIAQHTIAETIRRVGEAREAQVQAGVLEAMTAAGLATDHPPIVAFGANAANPHYEPHEGSDAVLAADEVVLVDLWGGPERRSVYADQTWMGFSGNTPPDDVAEVWTITRDARDAVVARLREAAEAGQSVTGADLDDVARGYIAQRGYGDAFVHRTGHSIDVDLHGSGPHLDNFETNDTRTIGPGLGFSVEPGIYLAGRFGVRSEINVVMHEDGPEVTPARPQTELITTS